MRLIVYSGLILGIIMLTCLGCSSDTTTLPDHKAQIDSNTARVILLEANDTLQDLRLDALESLVALLEGRMTQAEAAIDVNEINILALFDGLANLTADLDALRVELRVEIAALKKADKQTRRILRKRIAKLRRKLCREIKARGLADARLQSQIDALERTVKRHVAKQKMINMFLTKGLFFTNQRITQLQQHIMVLVFQVNRRLNRIEQDIQEINQEIDQLRRRLRRLRDRLEEMEFPMISVVFPCDDNEDSEVLLQTPEGLVAYLQEMRRVTRTFEAGVEIPTYFVCDKWAGSWHYSKPCVKGHHVSGYTTKTDITITFYVLERAYLGLLEDGWYGEEDGFSCEFYVEDGELGVRWED